LPEPNRDFEEARFRRVDDLPLDDHETYPGPATTHETPFAGVPIPHTHGVQKMPMHFVPLTQCPFCAGDGAGHLLVDAAGVAKERAADHAASGPEDSPANRFFLFNTAREALDPCEHLLLLTGAIDWSEAAGSPEGSRTGWSQGFHFRCPRLGELHSDEVAYEYFWAALHGNDADSPGCPATPFSLEQVHATWPDVSVQGQNGGYYQVSGSALFTANVNELMAELHDLGVEYQQWVRDGRPASADTIGEDNKWEFVEDDDVEDQ
jgi:hypothetical protein